MKKLGALLVTCFLGLSLSACGNPTPASQGSAEKPPIDTGSAVIAKPEVPDIGSAQGSGSAAEEADPNVRTFRDCTITVTGYSLSKDENGDPALRVEYLFENKSKSAASFSTTVIPSAYQDETETYDDALEYATPAEADTAYTAMLTLIQPGETIVCAGYYKLESTEIPVHLKVLDLRDSSADALVRTLDIASLAAENEKNTTETTETTVPPEDN